MADFTLGQAAKRLGLSKPTIAKYIRVGRLAGEKLPDGSYRISGGELAKFEASFKKPTTGRAIGEKPGQKRDQVAHKDKEIIDLKAQLDFTQREMAIEAKSAEREKEYLEREVADLKSKVRDLTRDLESTRNRLDQAQEQLATIAQASIERGVAPWWQRVIGRN